jgi:hypothetical protein
VRRRLCDAGYDDARVESLLTARDPYAAYHHCAPDAAGLLILPRPFRTSILPLLRRRPWGEVMRSLRFYRELDLARDPDLLALVTRLLVVSGTHGPSWAAVVSTQLPERRSSFVRIVMQTGACAVDPAGMSAGALNDVAGLDARRYEDRLTYLLECLRAGYPGGHAVEGFRIADTFAPGHEFVSRWRRRGRLATSKGRRLPPGLEPVLRPVLEHIHDAIAADGYGTFSMTL